MKSPGFDNNPDCSWKPMVCIALLLAFSFSSLAWAQGLSTARLDMLIGSQDSMMVLDPTGTVVYAKNEQKELVPASTLKLLTALTVFHWLGSDFHFMTDFFQDSQGNLTIKGYGDPLLISEEVNRICGLLANRINEVGDIILDDGFFADPLTIPGISNSSQPYDAPNGALCVNFNTIFFKTDGKRFVSAEPQTPLLPSALLKIQASGLKKGRIALSHQRRETTLYTGKMFRYFMKENGVAVRGRIRLGDVSANTGNKLVFHHTSPFSLSQIVSGLMEHSNNFTANQLLIASGAAAFGPPGNLEKAVKAARLYAADHLGLKELQLAEGSGISRKNKLSASDMMVVLELFTPYARLLKKSGKERFKTGSLKDVRTRAGYIRSEKGGIYRYVVMLNTPGKTTDAVMAVLKAGIE